jgi:hypothetical protein
MTITETKRVVGFSSGNVICGVKTYKGKNKDGSVWEKTMSWFGYKLHLIVEKSCHLFAPSIRRHQDDD